MDLKAEEADRTFEALEGCVLTKNEKNDTFVILRGQFGETSHDDLGKLITYSAGLNAMTVVWVAPKISEECRKALDWLNEVSHEEIGFYGAELELWRIGDSAPAPKFTLVCGPNASAKHLKGGLGVLQAGEEQILPPTKEEEELSNGKSPGEEKQKFSPKHVKSKDSAKEDVAVRQNFVYTKTFS
jgi:hypothetical protein